MNPATSSTAEPPRTWEPSDGSPGHPLRNPSHLSRHPRAPAPAYRLHSPVGITWATALGGPAAGGIVLALNYWKWGEKAVAAAVVVAGFVATSVVAWLAIITPASVPAVVFFVPQVLVGYFVARWLQGRRFDAHVAAGGGKISSGVGAAIGLGFGMLMLGAFAIWFVSTGINPKALLDTQESVDFGHGQQVFYSNGASRDAAQDFGEALTRGGYFDGTVAAEVWIAGQPGKRVISFVGAEGAWDDPVNVDYMHELTEYIAADIGGKPVTVVLLDGRCSRRSGADWMRDGVARRPPRWSARCDERHRRPRTAAGCTSARSPARHRRPR